ncbi:MAG: hypothetical protein AB7S26_20160 [Sandaracinaceae bacterium]
MLAGCPSPGPTDAGVDATVSLDAGEACASHDECVASARLGGHDRAFCVGGVCTARCAEGAECAGHPYGPMCLGTMCGCMSAADCPGFPSGCFGGRCGECSRDEECIYARALACSAGACVRCRTDAECEPGRTCTDGACIGADDMDGDGYATPDDCDDADPARHPGALAICGNGAREGCPGAWDALAQDLGVAEAGARRLRRVLDGGSPDTQITSVAAASLADETYVAFVYRGPGSPGVVDPRIVRLFAVPFEAPAREIPIELTDLDCGRAAPVTMENAERVSLSLAADGVVHLAVGAIKQPSPTVTEQYLAYFTITAGTPTFVRCELADDMTQFGYAAVGVAAESGDVGALLRGASGSRDNVYQTFGLPTELYFRSRDWLDGQGALVVTRSRASAGGPVSLHFTTDGVEREEMVSTVSAVFDQGRAALAASPSGEYAVVLPTDQGTFLVEGQCGATGCAPAAVSTSWDLTVEDVPDAHWVGGTHFAVAYADYVMTQPTITEAQIHLHGFERLRRPVAADLDDSPILASRRELPGMGSLVVRDIDVGARADRVDVAFVVQLAGGAPGVFLSRVALCAAE